MNIILTGSLSIDQIMIFDGKFEDLIQPDKLRVLSVSPLVQQFRRTRGGIAGNIAYNLALLGEKSALLCSIGKESHDYMNELKKLGVDTSHMHFSQTPTGTFSALTDQNDCQVGGFYPGAMGDAKTLSFVPFADTDTLAMISAHEPKQMNVQVHECVKNSIPYCYDPSHQITAFTKSEILYGVSHAEIVFVNDYELGLLEKATKLTTQALLQMIKVCVVTLGEKGSFVYEQREDNRLHIPAVKIEKLIDPTGAGDAFRAGFLYGYIRQWPLERCAQLGSVVAAYACEKHGTQEHTFSRGNVNKRFEQTYKTKLNLK